MNYAEEQKLKNDRKLLTVAEVCELAGTTPSVLHAARRKGLVPNPTKSVGGTALYYDCLDALEIIRHFGRKSFPIGLGRACQIGGFSSLVSWQAAPFSPPSSF
jgi:hypothetical protein